MTPHSMCRCMHNCQKHTAMKIHRYKKFKKNSEYLSHTIWYTISPSWKLDKKKTHGFLREAQPAWTSNCEGLICIAFNKWNSKVLYIQNKKFLRCAHKDRRQEKMPQCYSIDRQFQWVFWYPQAVSANQNKKVNRATGLQQFVQEIHTWTTCPRA